jgi:outer membrane protein assembly factor BamB
MFGKVLSAGFLCCMPLFIGCATDKCADKCAVVISEKGTNIEAKSALAKVEVAQAKSETKQAAAAAKAAPLGGADDDSNWTALRGSNNTGYVNRANFVTEWDEAGKKNILWKAKLSFGGASSPVVWGDKIFVTEADAKKRLVSCFDKKTGKKLWSKGYKSTGAKSRDLDYEEVYAGSTPAVTGQYLAATFSTGDLVCFDHSGKEIWAKNLGDTESNSYGYCNSLLAYKDNVIVQFDDGNSNKVISVNLKTGEEIWRSEAEGTSWSSPSIVNAEAGAQIVINTSPFVYGFDAETGKELWKAEVLSGDVAPSPTTAAGNVIAIFDTSGIFSIKTGGSGDVTKTGIAWKIEQLENSSVPDTISPVGNEEFLYIYNSSMLACIDAKSGKVIYEKDVEESSTYSSPLIINDKLFLFGAEKTFVIQTGKEYKLLSTNKIDDPFNSTPAFAGGNIYIRSDSNLYCIGSK